MLRKKSKVSQTSLEHKTERQYTHEWCKVLAHGLFRGFYDVTNYNRCRNDRHIKKAKVYVFDIKRVEFRCEMAQKVLC